MQRPDGSACGCASPRGRWSSRRGRWIRGGDRRRALGGAAAEGARIALAYQGPVAPEVEAAFADLRRGAGRGPAGDHQPRPAARGLARGAGGAADGERARSHVERMLAPLAPGAALVTRARRHPATHAWLGAVRGQRVVALGPDHFGQSGDIPDLYREYGMDTDAILDACAQALLAG